MAEASSPPMDVQKYLAEKSASAQVSAPPMDVQKYLSEKSGSKPDVPWYQVENPTARNMVKATLESLPTIGMIGGGVVGTPADVIAGPLGTVAGAGVGAAAGKSLQNIGEKYLLGENKDAKQVALDTLKSGLEGVAAEVGGQALGAVAKAAARTPVGQAVTGAVSSGVSKVAGKLGSMAENLAVNATGATGAQSSKFADDAGRQLLDRGLVKFGDNAKNVAERVGAANDSAYKAIDQTLKSLDAKGVTASADNVVEELQNNISKLKKDPSQAGTVRKLQGIIEDIKATGESTVPISQGEQTKRGFNKIAGNWMDPEVGQAGKQAYQAYKNEVESAATSANPDLAKKFTDAKESYGLLAPIQEAAERRAATVRQSPIGGLGDYVAIGAGGAAGGPIGATASLVGKKVVAPRVASSAAVTLDSISQALQQSPQMLKLAKADPIAFQTVVKNVNDHIMSNIPSVVPAAADNAQPKGRDKWASDGIDKLMKHSDDPAFIKQLSDKKDDPKVKDLLIKASDLKPGSKAMDDIMSKIKDRVSNGGQ